MDLIRKTASLTISNPSFYFMKKKKLNRSLKKHIRREKARIRREVLKKDGQEKLIEELYKKVCQTYENKGNI